MVSRCPVGGVTPRAGVLEAGLVDLEGLRAGLRIMALRALGDPEAADEVAQETLARTSAALRDGGPADPAKLGAFVAGIARDVIADSLRARYRSVPLDVVPDHALPSHDPDPLGALVTAAESERVRAALAALRPRDRELLRLSFFEGLTPTELGARLGERVDRIRKRKSRALERLRRALAGGPPGHGPKDPPTGKEGGWGTANDAVPIRPGDRGEPNHHL